MATRCCWPPDSSEGRWRARSLSPTLSRAARVAAAALGPPQAERDERGLDVISCRQRRQEIEGLENEADRPGPDVGDARVVQSGQIGAGCRPVERAQQLQQRGLAVPGATLDRQPVTVRNLQADLADGGAELSDAPAPENARQQAPGDGEQNGDADDADRDRR
jgi:hypothetical protein